MTGPILVGGRIVGVAWAPSKTPGYARYFLRLDSGRAFEIGRDFAVEAAIPADAKDWSSGFAPILGKAAIEEIRTDDQSDLAIRLESGHMLVLFGTYDGTNVGNNFSLQSPSEAAEWNDEFQEMRRLYPPSS